jgi:Rieske Fe-S protein
MIGLRTLDATLFDGQTNFAEAGIAPNEPAAAVQRGSDRHTPPPKDGGGGTSTLPTLTGQFANSRVQVTTTSALANVDSAALIESIAGLFLVARTSLTTFTAIDATCTHEGCTVNGLNGAIYVCPCHGSRYNRNGQVVNGPAKAALRQYNTSFANDVLTITL